MKIKKLWSFYPNQNGNKAYESHVCECQLIITSGNVAKSFQFEKVFFYQMPLFIQPPVAMPLKFGSFVAQCINFPLQRNITFKSHGNVAYQAMWYFIAWIVISLVCNGFNNLWMPIAQQYVAPAVYNILVTIITGGVSMVIFFFVFKIIFPEGEAKK